MFACEDCDAAFPSAKQLATHKLKKHRDGAIMGRFLIDTWCPACLLQVHTRTRLLKHLKHSRGNDPCAYYIATQFAPEDEAAVALAAEHERSRAHAAARSGFRAHYASMPAVQLEGPLPRLHCRRRHLQHLPIRPAFRRALADAIVDESDDDDDIPLAELFA